MQRTSILLACFFICTNSFAQQYPFVHYTPKDGLISNQIRNIYQDNKGRLYFTSVHGLSVYDGSRFTNYNSKNGLGFDIVNCVMEMGNDSIWIVTNSSMINCLVNGRMKLLSLHNEGNVINNLCKDEKGDIYAAAEQGLLLFNNKDRFIKLPFVNTKGASVNTYIAYMFSIGDYLIVQRDASLLPDEDNFLYLYNKTTKMITSELSGIYGIQIAPDGRIWVSSEKGIMAIDTIEVKKGKFVLQELPTQYAQLRNKSKYFVLFDSGNNCWVGDQSSVLLKTTSEGITTVFTPASGLSMFYINFLFRDREGITWIATNNAGVNKLVHSNFSLFVNPFNISPPLTDISYNDKDQMLFFAQQDATAVFLNNTRQVFYKVKNASDIKSIIETPNGILGVTPKNILRMVNKNGELYPEIIYSDSSDNLYSNSTVDKNGNLIICGKSYITVLVNGKTIVKKKLNYYADYSVIDRNGNIWITTRAGEMIMFQPRPEFPSEYLEEKLYFKKELQGISPRSLIIDKNDNIWIGSRSNGIHVFRVENGSLIKKFNLTSAMGLSDDFVWNLACDRENNIWACSALGLDKIAIKNGIPVTENLTKQNNIYQSVFEVVIDKNNTAWATVSNGLIKITLEKERSIDYFPSLMVGMIKAGKDTIPQFSTTPLSYRQNNLSFQFAATSFFDEKQIQYSYRLSGGTNSQWSEQSNNNVVSFIDLPPGNYTLNIKANFPAGRYPEQIISYKFLIAPPWWQTWWFKSIAGLFIIGLIITGFRFYYRRKLEKQMAILEKQQAIEKERTRIATDMHDDLGAGLSRIKFLSETIGIKKQQQQSIDDEVSSIRNYSHEMIDKMGEIVWALNEKNDSLSDLLSYTRAYTMEYLSQNGIDCKAEMPESFPSVFVSGEFRRNIFLTIKEALHNVVKHSQATEVKLTININHHLTIKLKDNGIGFYKNNIRSFSNGLSNMESRVKEIGGKIDISNKQGTLINLSIPLHA
jgi:ligand-binding sensor domain-containing protein/two-component sensor histidine kinase